MSQVFEAIMILDCVVAKSNAKLAAQFYRKRRGMAGQKRQAEGEEGENESTRSGGNTYLHI